MQRVHPAPAAGAHSAAVDRDSYTNIRTPGGRCSASRHRVPVHCVPEERDSDSADTIGQVSAAGDSGISD
eukprot:290466-Hanusia_phi.AAC.1